MPGSLELRLTGQPLEAEMKHAYLIFVSPLCPSDFSRSAGAQHPSARSRTRAG